MAKNKKRKSTASKSQPISPKKYLQTKVRQLPIHICYINEDWEQTKLAEVIVTRKHTNGNLTFGAYLTDILGMGVKDTMFGFNRTTFEFEELLLNMGGKMVTCDYVLAHNLVYGAVDFALEYDIPSHRDWNLTQYILEEDTEDIPLMDLEFGVDGKPVFLSYDGEDEDYSWDEDEEFEDEDAIDEEDMIRNAQKLVYSTIDLAYEKSFPIKPDHRSQQIKDAHMQLIITEEPDHEIEEEEADALEFLYFELHNLVESEDKSGIKKFRRQISDKIHQYPNQPIFRNYLANSYFLVGDVAEGDKQFEQCVKDFPDYLLGRLFHAFQLTQNNQYWKAWEIIEGKSELQELMPHRKSFHPQEVFVFYAVAILCLLNYENNLEKTFPYYELILSSEDDPLRWISVSKAVDAVSKAKANALEKKFNKELPQIMEDLGVIPDFSKYS
ncbi:hypothetical protein SYJ56_12895 [Algoriphagus sp. D3-2-R+10]|uniref:hypothetical protein n=1 Tax=Algoriphagus aurantiacus TaxID=3103948 RepID=UPI002B3A3E8F|nr:hypothetical protein [Algoriphagus sp. D3-2-R+10]MEB2776213.1 hypothetical protein [Algoriphagus sp. D3-2-R+10]